MLRSVEQLKDYTIQATDGEIGKVDEIFFDENTWHIRYLVVDVGNWLFGRWVLIAPPAVVGIDDGSGLLTLSLTRDKINNSPPVKSDEPISRENERALHEHYHWTPYWTGGVTDPLHGAYPAALLGLSYAANYRHAPKEDEDNEKMVQEEQEESGSTLRSTAEICGYSIQTNDGEIGSVSDFLFDDERWAIRDLVIDTGTWLPGRKVLVAPPWIEEIRWSERNVYVSLTRESVRQSPPFDPSLLDIDAYEEQLLEHYKKWFTEYVLGKARG